MTHSDASALDLRRHTPWLNASRLERQPTRENLLHQTAGATIRRSRLDGGATVAVLSFRSSYPKKAQLWQSALRILGQHFALQPLHPNIVPVLAVAGSSIADTESRPSGIEEPSGIILELMASSVYDVLHVDRMEIPAADIVFIATEVLSALQYLHCSNQSFGSTLTSRKVMLGGTRHVKLRRFCLELISREAGVFTTNESSSSSQYWSPPTSSAVDTAEEELRRAQRQDLYAFGMLLLEMCTREKPTSEIFNSISQAGQLDPRLERVIRATLNIKTGHSTGRPTVAADPPNAALDEPAALIEFCIQQLAECSQASTTPDGSISNQRRPCHSFASFLHADRYFQEIEGRAVEQRAAETTLKSSVALKRLAAVEEELVEEQRNFEVVVRQLEQIQLEKTHGERDVAQQNAEIKRLHGELHSKDEAVQATHQNAVLLNNRNEDLEEILRNRDDALQRAHADRLAIERERQELLVEVLRLKDDKRDCLDQKHDVERQLAEVAAKVGGEKDAVEELDARWKQTIHRCEQEQRARKAVERQLEGISRQLVAMEDERSRYTALLQFAPTGPLDARSSQQLVVELKEKEVKSLRQEIQMLNNEISTARQQLQESERERRRLEDVVCVELEQEADRLAHDLEQLSDRDRSLEEERDSLMDRLRRSTQLTEQQADAIAGLETQVFDLQNQAADAEKARRMRQCLTPNCDAPRYLVKPSGFCVDCEEKMAKQRGKSRSSVSSSSSPQSRGTQPSRGHQRQRSLDGAQAILNNTKNTPIIDVVKRIEIARDCDDESREESTLELVTLLKELGKLLKDTASLKEDLPECGVLRCVLSVMEQFLSSLPVVIEATKTLSVTVFNHDRNRIILVAEGAVEVLLKMMKAHLQEVKVQEIGAVLLTNLSHHCESNRQRILAAGGVDAVLEAMQLFPRATTIQKKCCWALLTLAGSDFMCDKIASLGGVGATLAAMLNCPGDEAVQHYGSWALLNLIAGTEQLQDFARREGVVEVVEAALACFPEHLGIQEKCQEILSLIYTDDEKSS